MSFGTSPVSGSRFKFSKYKSIPLDWNSGPSWFGEDPALFAGNQNPVFEMRYGWTAWYQMKMRTGKALIENQQVKMIYKEMSFDDHVYIMENRRVYTGETIWKKPTIC